MGMIFNPLRCHSDGCFVAMVLRSISATLPDCRDIPQASWRRYSLAESELVLNFIVPSGNRLELVPSIEYQPYDAITLFVYSKESSKSKQIKFFLNGEIAATNSWCLGCGVYFSSACLSSKLKGSC